MGLPDTLAFVVNAAYSVMVSDSLHRLSAIRRQHIYAALGPRSHPTARYVRGWLAVMTAKHVLPIFQQAPFPKEEVSAEDLELPYTLLNMGFALLQGTDEQNQARDMAAEGHEAFSLLLREAYDHPDRFPMNAAFAALATQQAVFEILGYDQYLTLDIVAKTRWLQHGTPDLKPADPITEAEFAVEWPDTAGYAAIASACSSSSAACKPEYLETFWEWWLTEAVSMAWDSSTYYTDAPLND